MEMGTYISINEEIKKILTVDDSGERNRDARLWHNHAPMKMIWRLEIVIWRERN